MAERENALSFGVPTFSADNQTLVNPLAAIVAGQQAAKGTYDLRASQASEAAGQAYQAAINPETGEFDANRFRSLLANNPTAAMAAGASLQNVQNISDQDLQQKFKKAGWINSRAGAALQTGDFSDEAMRRIVQDGLAAGTLTMPDAQRFLTTLPPDAAGRQRLLQEHQDTAATFQEQMTQRFGTRPAVNTGPTTVFPVVPSPRAGGEGPVVRHDLSPDSAAQIVDVNLDNGQKVQVPLGIATQMLAKNPALQALNPHITAQVPNAPWTSGGGYPGGASRGGQGQGAGTAAPASTTQAPATPAATTTPPTSQTTPFQSSADRADATATRPAPQIGITPPRGFDTQRDTGSKAAAAMEGEAATARTQLQPLLVSMLPELEATGNTGAGQKVLSFAQQMAIRTGMAPPRLDPTTKQASSEDLAKIMTRYQGAQLAALGTSPSDSRQNLAEGMSPSMGYSREGNRKIVFNLMGNNDALDTMNTAWLKSRARAQDPGNFTQWREAFTRPVEQGELKGAKFDPVIFMVNRMPPAEQHRYLKDFQTASPNDFAQFKKNYALGQREGWVKPIGGQ